MNIYLKFSQIEFYWLKAWLSKCNLDARTKTAGLSEQLFFGAIKGGVSLEYSVYPVIIVPFIGFKGSRIQGIPAKDRGIFDKWKAKTNDESDFLSLNPFLQLNWRRTNFLFGTLGLIWLQKQIDLIWRHRLKAVFFNWHISRIEITCHCAYHHPKTTHWICENSSWVLNFAWILVSDRKTDWFQFICRTPANLPECWYRRQSNGF